MANVDKIDNTTIGELVKAQRTHLLLTQGMAAALCGIPLHTLRNVESGADGVALKSVLSVMSGLGLKIKIEGLADVSNNMQR